MIKSPFLRFVTASGMTNLADGVATVAWSWLASLLTRDPLLIALVPVALRLPWALFALPAGIITDRMDRRVLILRMDILRALAFAGAAAIVWAALPLAMPPPQGLAAPGMFVAILCAALLVGIAEVFRDNAAQTMVPSLVPHDALERANGRLWSVELVGNALVGPALGAALIGVALPLPFAVNAVAYAAAVWLVFRLSGSFGPEPGALRDWRRELGEGIRFLRGAPLLRLLAWLTGLWNLLFQMVLIGLVLHVQDNLGLSVRAYGLVLAGGAVGGILGGFFQRPDHPRPWAGADRAMDAGKFGPGVSGDCAGTRPGGAGSGAGAVRVYRAGVEHGVGFLPAAGYSRCVTGPGEQSVPAAGLGDDAGGADRVGRPCAAGRGSCAARSGAAGTVRSGGIGGCGGGRVRLAGARARVRAEVRAGAVMSPPIASDWRSFGASQSEGSVWTAGRAQRACKEVSQDCQPQEMNGPHQKDLMEFVAKRKRDDGAPRDFQAAASFARITRPLVGRHHRALLSNEISFGQSDRYRLIVSVSIATHHTLSRVKPTLLRGGFRKLLLFRAVFRKSPMLHRADPLLHRNFLSLQPFDIVKILQR